MHEHLIKWLSEIIKKQNEEYHICELLGDVVLVIQIFIVMSEKGGCWHGTKTDILCITYSILQTLILKSVLVFFTFTLASVDDTDLIIVRL